MEKYEMLEIVKEQERLLRFERVSFSRLQKIGLDIASLVSKMGAAGYVRIAVNGTTVFAMCLDGASSNNEEWARRKANLVARYSVSSLHTALDFRMRERSLEECGMDSISYGLSGGSFPILLSEGISIGSITFSGLKETEDHQIVANAIAKELSISIPSVT